MDIGTRQITSKDGIYIGDEPIGNDSQLSVNDPVSDVRPSTDAYYIGESQSDTAVQTESPLCTVHDCDEELVSVDHALKFKHPYWHAKIRKNSFAGFVEDIEQGKETKELLFRVRYEDGDLEHLSLTMVQQCLAGSTREVGVT